MNPSRRKLLACSLLLPASWPLMAAPEVQRLDFEWVDSKRQRPVPVRLYLPSAPGTAVPLVVFSHGIGGSRLGYSYLGRHWAEQGFASLHVQHVGSDRSLWSAGNVFSLASRLQSAAQDSEAIARTQDLRFAIDQLLVSDVAPRIDAQRIAAAGHSYGANTTLLVSGARVVREDRLLNFRDPRISAAIVISAPPFYGEGSPRDILQSVSIPSLHVTSTEDIIRVPGYYSDSADRIEVFEAMGGPRKALAVFQGGAHSMFTDRMGPGGPLYNAQVKQATQELTTAFLHSWNGHSAQGVKAWRDRHASIVARFVTQGDWPS